VDVLGHGLFLIIRDKLEGAYAHAGVKMELGSSEAIIYALSERKSEDSIEKMRLAAKRADDLLREAFGEIRVGMSERDIAQLVHLRFNEKPNYFLEKGIVSESYAWDEALCPVVLVGPNLTKGGHSEPSEFRIERGHTVYFDFGVKLMFADGTGWASDIQRMGYVLREGEVEAPSEIARTFATLLNAIDTGISTIRPGMLGHQVDALVRHVITSAGYPNYLHATGHAIGETAHDPGALLGNNEAGLAQLRIQPNGVYTIEPRIAIENGGSIEEMIYVSNSGGIAVSPRQTSLFIIG
jgi:Xaa-Pro aminopeptidase